MTVFEALADPTRREILDRLRTAGPLSVNDLAEPFSMSRQAVTKHLDALEASGLVRSRREGRQRLHEIDPRPLEAVDAWLAPYAAQWDRRLERLKRHLEAEWTEREGRRRRRRKTGRKGRKGKQTRRGRGEKR